MSVPRAESITEEVIDEVLGAVVADRDLMRTLMTGVLGRGHVLLEDVPGTGKTLTARSLATALGLEFNRIQFTPDLLPADITGSHVYNEHEGAFEFEEGPIFANVVLADEINRSPPKTQAALLEAMGEGQVTVDGETHPLPEPFFVIATQNPVEQEGTFELPEAQRDRFMIKTSIGYPSFEGDRLLIDRRADRETKAPTVEQVADEEAVGLLRQVPERVEVVDELRDYIATLCRRTREDSRIEVGVSPRGVQRLFEAARARAVIDGRDYVVPDDVLATARPVLVHRLVVSPEAAVKSVDAAEIVEDALASVEVPSMPEAGTPSPTGE